MSTPNTPSCVSDSSCSSLSMETPPKTTSSPSPQPIKPQHSVDTFPTPPHDDAPRSLRVKGRRSPAPKKLMEMQRAASTPPEITRDHATSTPTKNNGGELLGMSDLESSWQRHQLLRKKSQYYDEAFAYRELNNTAKDRVSRDSIVMAEVVLNCRLECEKEFMHDFSFQLSEIYQRPESSIMVIVSPQVPMMLGGTSEPAYRLTITALHADVSPAKNKRSTHLLQEFMLDSLHIRSKRGVIHFEGVAEENLATKGVTIQQEIEDMERKEGREETGILRAISRQSNRRGKKSMVPIFTERGKTPIPPPSRGRSPSHLKTVSEDTNTSDHTAPEYKAPEPKRVKHRKSIMAFFRRTD